LLTLREEELSLAFNGGKDNMLLLHLIVLYLQKRGRSVEGFNAIYFVDDDDFEEVQCFVEKIAGEYDSASDWIDGLVGCLVRFDGWLVGWLVDWLLVC
jgi:predicted phosphoadenosine phosphosulfate sulfurtransferase